MVDRKDVIQKALDNLVHISIDHDCAESIDQAYQELVAELGRKCEALKVDMAQSSSYSSQLADLQQQLSTGDSATQKRVWRHIKNLEEEMLFDQPTAVNLDLSAVRREISNLGASSQSNIPPIQQNTSRSTDQVPQSPSSQNFSQLNLTQASTQPAVYSQPQSAAVYSQPQPAAVYSQPQPAAVYSQPQPPYNPPQAQPNYSQPPFVPQQEQYIPPQQNYYNPPTQPPPASYYAPEPTIQPQSSQSSLFKPQHSQPPSTQSSMFQPPPPNEDRSRQTSSSSMTSNRARRNRNPSQETITPRGDTQLPSNPAPPPNNHYVAPSNPAPPPNNHYVAPSNPAPPPNNHFVAPSNLQSRPASSDGVRPASVTETQKLFSPDMFRMDNALPNANQNANNLQNANIAKSQFNNVPNDLLPHHLQPIQGEQQDQLIAYPTNNAYNQVATLQNTGRGAQSGSSVVKYVDMCKNPTIKRFFTMNLQYTNPNSWSKLEIAEFYNPHKFFVKAEGSSNGVDKTYDLINIKIMDHLSSANLDHNSQKSYADGALVLSKFRDDDQWYRGVITKHHGEFWYEVLFIDFGNGQNSNYTELRPMPNILQRFPMMAQQCFLAEIEQPSQYLDSVETSDGWLQDNNPLIWDMLSGKDLLMRVLSEKKQVYGVVIMIVQEDGSQVNLNKTLIDTGLAKRDESCYSMEAQESVRDICQSPTRFSPSTTFDEIPAALNTTPFDQYTGPRGRGALREVSEMRRPGFDPSAKKRDENEHIFSGPVLQDRPSPVSSPALLPSSSSSPALPASPSPRRARRVRSPSPASLVTERVASPHYAPIEAREPAQGSQNLKFGRLDDYSKVPEPIMNLGQKMEGQSEIQIVSQQEQAICEVLSKHRIPHSTEDALDLASLAAEIKPDTFGKQRVYAKASPPSNRGKGSHEAEDDLSAEPFILDELEQAGPSNEPFILDELEQAGPSNEPEPVPEPEQDMQQQKYNPAFYELGNMTKEHVLEMCRTAEPISTLQIEPLQSGVLNAVHITHVNSPYQFYALLLNQRNVAALAAINSGLKALYDPPPVVWSEGDSCSQSIQGVQWTGEVVGVNKNLIQVKWSESSTQWVEATVLAKGTLPSNNDLHNMLSAAAKPSKVLVTLDLAIGTYCAAAFTSNKETSWHRALVIEVFRKKSSVVYKYQVMFVDYGNVEMCGVKHVRALPPKYLALPAQAIPCFVNEIAPVKSDSISDDDTQSVDSDCDDDTGLRGDYSVAAAEAFENLIRDERVYLLPRADDSTPSYYGPRTERTDVEGRTTNEIYNKKVQVSIYDSVADDFIDLLDEFIGAGHAERTIRFTDAPAHYNPTDIDDMTQRMDKLAQQQEDFNPEEDLMMRELDGEISSNYDTDSATLSTFDPMSDHFSSETNLVDFDPDDISQAVYKEKLSKRRLCKFYSRGRKCYNGAACTFLHQRKTDFSSEQSNVTIVTDHKPPTPDEDMPIIVAVQSVVSAFHFWAQILPQEMNPAQISLGDFEINDPLSQLTRQMTAHYQYRGYREKRLYPAIGEICAVRSRQANGNYRRSRVTETDEVGERQCQVFHLDFGTFEILPEDSLRVMEKQFILELPFQAQEMFLADIKPSYPPTDEPIYIKGVVVDNAENIEEVKAAKEFFKSKVINKWPIAKVIEKSQEGALMVHLWDCTKDDWCSINEELVRAGHAESLHPLPADLTTDNETTVANSTFDRSFMNASSAALDSD